MTAGRRRYDDHDRALLVRAARLARLPGVNRAQVCARFGLSAAILRRAVKELSLEAIPSPRDLVLHAITDAGTRRSGKLPDLASVASYVDYVNKDGSTAADVATIIDALVREKVLARAGDTWRLLGEFP